MSAALDILTPAAPATLNGWPEDLKSPVSGARLLADGPHSLAGGGERWPVVDGIAYLRTGRAGLIEAVLQSLDSGDTIEATALLLQDRSDDAQGEAASLDALRMLVARRDRLGFREAMRGLGFGADADYFGHRWSDPTFLSGLALAEAHWNQPARLLDVGCGVGQFLRAAARHAGEVWGADIVFANLWLARNFVAPNAALICFDAGQAWPLPDASADLLVCHDVLHAIAQPRVMAAEAGRVAAGGAILCGRAPPGAASLFGAATLYDDAELTAALVARRAPRVRAGGSLEGLAAIAIAAGSAAAERPLPVVGMLSMPPRGAALRRNPLYCEEADGACVRRFPSHDYAEAVGPLATYPPRVTARARVIAGADPADDALIRRRVWLDLPSRW